MSKFATVLRAARPAAPALARDGAGLLGGFAVVHGAGEIYPPAAWLISGAMLIGIAFLAARRA
jgi:hypothetical protein